MKVKVLLILLLTVQAVISQKYFTRTGIINFKASTATFEPVEALNNSSTSIVTNDGKIAAQVFINAFKFKVALMQEHFNENYMESDSYPKATFKGNIIDFDFNNLKDTNDFKLQGVLNIRGKDKSIDTTAKITKLSDDSFRLIASFDVTPQDFNIKIPSIVRKKIAKSIIIDIDYEFKEKK